MAIGTPTSIGSGAGSANGSTRPMTTTAPVAAGDSIVVVVGSAGSGRTLTSVTDSVGNTYSIDRAQVASSASFAGLWIASCHNATALPSSSTITATFGSTITAASKIQAMTVSGLAKSSTLDKVTSQEQSGGTAWSSGATAATGQADELVVGGSIAPGNFTSTPGGSYTELFDVSANTQALTTTYLIVAGTGAQTASGAWSSATNKSSAVATYKALTVQTIAVGQATETDTSQPIAKLKARAAAQSTETDTAQALAKLKSRALAQATETDAAQPVAKLKARALAQATSTETAGSIAPSKSSTVGQVAETSTSQSVTASKQRTLSQATSTNTAQPLTATKTGAVGRASEFDTAQQVTPPNATPVGRASETNTAGAIVALKTYTLGRAVSVEVSLPITGAKALAVNQTLEADTAGAFTAEVALPADSYTDAVVGILTVAPTTGIFTSPANRN